MHSEVIGIRLCAEEMIRRRSIDRNIVILLDSQAAIQAIGKSVVHSKMIKTCLNALNNLGARNDIILGWIPGHSSLDGNEIADNLANKGGAKLGVDLRTPLSEIHRENEIKEKEEEIVNKLWRESESLRHSKMMMKGVDQKRTKKLLDLNKRKSRVAIGMLTGHCCLKRFLKIIGKSNDDTCRYCNDKVETMKHCLMECDRLDLTKDSKCSDISNLMKIQ